MELVIGQVDNVRAQQSANKTYSIHHHIIYLQSFNNTELMPYVLLAQPLPPNHHHVHVNNIIITTSHHLTSPIKLLANFFLPFDHSDTNACDACLHLCQSNNSLLTTMILQARCRTVSSDFLLFANMDRNSSESSDNESFHHTCTDTYTLKLNI